MCTQWAECVVSHGPFAAALDVECGMCSNICPRLKPCPVAAVALVLVVMMMVLVVLVTCIAATAVMGDETGGCL